MRGPCVFSVISCKGLEHRGCGCGCLTGFQDGPPIFLKVQLSSRWGTERVLERDFSLSLSLVYFVCFS